jgi:hypothetical protein
MTAAFRRSRMISFRLSPEEYERFTKLCSERGVRSISNMARIALQMLVAGDAEADPVAFEVRDLRSQIKTIVTDLERLAETVEGRKAKKAGGSA